MNITPTVSLLEVVLLFVGLLALWTAVDNAARALSDAGNLRKANVDGSRKRTARWSARNEILIAAVSLLFILRIAANMAIPEHTGEEAFAGDVIEWVSLAIGVAYLVVATWNKYDRRRLIGDYKLEDRKNVEAIADALATMPPVGPVEAERQAEAIVKEVHADKEAMAEAGEVLPLQEAHEPPVAEAPPSSVPDTRPIKVVVKAEAIIPHLPEEGK